LARVCLCINEILQLASFLRMLDKKMHNRQWKPRPASKPDRVGPSSDLGSWVTDTSDLHSEKQYSQIIWTDEGMWIDVKPLLRNAWPSNRDTFVSESNMTDASDLQSEKQPVQITWTDEGMWIDVKPLLQNA
jgi:hypothetical protein